MVFRPTVEALYGAAFCQAQDMARLQQAFFSFESGFELAASPVPHALQRAFCAARSHLLTSFRQVNTSHTVLGLLQTVLSSDPQPCWPDPFQFAKKLPHHQKYLAGASLTVTIHVMHM